MLCGGYTKIWPEPTKSYIGTSANSFSLLNVQYKIKTPFRAVESLLENAFSVFMDELHKIFHSSSAWSSDESSSSSSTTRFYRDDRQTASLDFASTHRKHNNNHTTVNVFLYVLKTSDTHLSLNTDECYNLTMTRKRVFVFEKVQFLMVPYSQTKIKLRMWKFQRIPSLVLEMVSPHYNSSSGSTT